MLIRTPYGRRSKSSTGYAEIFASRGYQVVVQSCRGTFGSGGEWLPFQTDREDGLATVEWLGRQPWYGGRIGMFGASYEGFVQWAIAADCLQGIGALSLQITASRPREMIYAGGGFALRTMLAWTYLVGSQAKGHSDTRIKLTRPLKLRGVFDRLPLGDLDRRVLGTQFAFFQDLLRSERAQAPLWQAMDFSDRVAEVGAPVFLVEGWYDIFLLGALADYRRLREAGRQPQLVIGPWGHSSLGWLGDTLRGSLRHFDTHLRGLPYPPPEKPVRVYLMGAGEWIELAEWPPQTRERRLLLHAGGRLATAEPVEAPPSRYRFDPRDPTPQAGGTSDPGFGKRDNRKLEARPDVLTFTTDPLPADLDLIGHPTVELFVRSSLEHTDFFARLCDVTTGGKSLNVCDGLARLDSPRDNPAPAEVRPLTIELWPTAYRFRPGHRLRLQLSSGSHPRFARNLGSGEPIITATTYRVAEQEIFHDPRHPSAVVIPAHGAGNLIGP